MNFTTVFECAVSAVSPPLLCQHDSLQLLDLSSSRENYQFSWWMSTNMKDTSNAYVPTINPFQRRAHITSLRRTSVRSLVCDDCWAGPYKYESFRKLVSGEDVLYHTTWNRVQRATAAGCGLCGVLINDEDLKPDNQEDVTFCLRFYQLKTSTPLDNFHAVTPHGAQLLEWRALGCEPQMRINGVFLRTSSGASLSHM